MNFYQFIIPRLNGKDIEKNFDYYHRLVKKGIAGFIIFGGRLETVRQGIIELQKASKKPLIIASDLEQGLGQHIEGGTIFPPAMAIASAIRSCRLSAISSQQIKLLRKVFRAMAIEARYAGINTIFAPVLDINTNPRNPIISTRAFGEDTETVSFFGCEMIKILQANGISACGKHFPGHGDTEIDSHIGLPLIKKDLQSLKKTELVPFRNAVREGVKMIMLGHLKVPALDPSGIPASLSEKVVRYIRDKMRFKGILITDALNMHALMQIVQNIKSPHPPFAKGGRGGIFEIASPSARNDRIGPTIEEEASLMALRAGVDLLLHPTDVDKVVAYLENTNLDCRSSVKRLNEFRKTCQALRITPYCDFEKHRELSEELTRRAIRITGQIKPIKKPFLIILNDDADNPSPIPSDKSPHPPFTKGGRGGILEKAMARRGGEGGFDDESRAVRGDKSLCEKGRVFAEKLKEKFPDLKLQIINRSSKIQKLTPPDNAFVIVAIFSETKAWKGGPSPWLLKCIKKLEEIAEIFISFGSPYILPTPTPLPQGEGARGRGAKIYAYWDSESAQKAVAELF